MAQETNLTAVEWFRDNPEATYEEGNKALQQAKQMYEGDIDNASYERFERYYQITFGGQGSPDTTTSPTK